MTLATKCGSKSNWPVPMGGMAIDVVLFLSASWKQLARNVLRTCNKIYSVCDSHLHFKEFTSKDVYGPVPSKKRGIMGTR